MWHQKTLFLLCIIGRNTEIAVSIQATLYDNGLVIFMFFTHKYDSDELVKESWISHAINTFLLMINLALVVEPNKLEKKQQSCAPFSGIFQFKVIPNNHTLPLVEIPWERIQFTKHFTHSKTIQLCKNMTLMVRIQTLACHEINHLDVVGQNSYISNRTKIHT